MPRPLAALAGLLLAATAAAAPPLDPAANTPYEWRVVVRAKPHPLLPAALREQLARDIKAALGPAVGPLASLEVIDLTATPPEKRDDLCRRFAETGWPALDAPASRSLTGKKTHFLTVEVVRNNRYRLEARQLDGDTGLTSPVLRTREVDAAEKLGRVAGMMLVGDFGPVATVEEFDPKAGTVMLRFRAGALGPLDKFVQPGDVLAVSVVREPPRPAPKYGYAPKPAAPPPPAPRDGRLLAYTLIRIDKPEGGDLYRGKVQFPGRATSLPTGAGVAGLRGLKLATVEETVAVRLVSPTTGQPVAPGGLIQVRATDTDYGKGPDARDALDLRDGEFRTARPLRHAATVTVAVGAYSPSKFQVPIVGRGPITIPYEPNPADAARAEFNQTCEDFFARVIEARVSQVALFDGLTVLIKDGKYQEALDRGTTGLKVQQATDKELTAELARLRGEPGAKDSRADAVLVMADARLQELKLGEPAVRQRIEELTAALAQAKDPARFEKEFRATDLQARLKQHLERGEGESALALYDQLVDLLNKDDIKARRAKFRDEWTPKSDEQKAARAYLTGPWRSVATADEFKAALPKVRNAADVLGKADDRYGLRGLVASLDPAYTRLREAADRLSGDNPADRPTIEALQEVTKGLDEVRAKAQERIKALDAKAAEKPAEK